MKKLADVFLPTFINRRKAKIVSPAYDWKQDTRISKAFLEEIKIRAELRQALTDLGRSESEIDCTIEQIRGVW